MLVGYMRIGDCVVIDDGCAGLVTFVTVYVCATVTYDGEFAK